MSRERRFHQTVQTALGTMELGYNPLDELKELIGEGGVNAHLHLDRTQTLTRAMFLNKSDIPLQAKWDIVDVIKEASSVDQIFARMAYETERMLEDNIRIVGTFIDIDPVVKDKAMLAAFRLREEFPEVTFVFMNQVLKGVRDPDARKWFDRGAEWVDHIGGLPGKDAEHEEEHLDILMGEAKARGKKVFVHVDQHNKPSERETELLLRKTIEHGMEGQVVAIHAISLGAQCDSYLDNILPQIAAAGIQFIACPIAWSDSRRNMEFAQVHNPVTPVDLLLKYGITVAVGSDNTNDVYTPGTDSSILNELDELMRMCRIRDLHALKQIATTNGRIVLGLREGGGNVS